MHGLAPAGLSSLLSESSSQAGRGSRQGRPAPAGVTSENPLLLSSVPGSWGPLSPFKAGTFPRGPSWWKDSPWHSCMHRSSVHLSPSPLQLVWAEEEDDLCHCPLAQQRPSPQRCPRTGLCRPARSRDAGARHPAAQGRWRAGEGPGRHTCRGEPAVGTLTQGQQGEAAGTGSGTVRAESITAPVPKRRPRGWSSEGHSR